MGIVDPEKAWSFETIWAILGIIVAIVSTIYVEYKKWRGVKSDETLRYEYQKSFDKIISDLSSCNKYDTVNNSTSSFSVISSTKGIKVLELLIASM